VIWAINTYLVDLEWVTEWVTAHLHWAFVVLVLGLSEVVFGILPPDFFILWAHTFSHPWAMVLLLATVSYAGGLASYWIGQRLHHVPKIKELVDVRFASHFIQIKRFGGLLIFLAALTPLPFPPVCTVAGVVNFRFRWFLWVAATRFLRFFLYALFIFGLV
jgi:membrane protein YqaA with SNARE-associated domain